MFSSCSARPVASSHYGGSIVKLIKAKAVRDSCVKRKRSLDSELVKRLGRIFRANESEVSAGMKCRGKREVPEKTRRPAASSGTIPTCENPGATPSAVLLLGSNLVPHNSLSTAIPRRHKYSDILPSFTVLESTPDSTTEEVAVFPKVELFLVTFPLTLTTYACVTLETLILYITRSGPLVSCRIRVIVERARRYDKQSSRHRALSRRTACCPCSSCERRQIATEQYWCRKLPLVFRSLSLTPGRERETDIGPQGGRVLRGQSGNYCSLYREQPLTLIDFETKLWDEVLFAAQGAPSSLQDLALQTSDIPSRMGMLDGKKRGSSFPTQVRARANASVDPFQIKNKQGIVGVEVRVLMLVIWNAPFCLSILKLPSTKKKGPATAVSLATRIRDTATLVRGTPHLPISTKTPRRRYRHPICCLRNALNHHRVRRIILQPPSSTRPKPVFGGVKCRVDIGYSRTLGATRDLEKFLGDGLRPYKYRPQLDCRQSLVEAIWLSVGCEVQCGRLRDDGGQRVRGVNGREGVKPDELRLLCTREPEISGVCDAPRAMSCSARLAGAAASCRRGPQLATPPRVTSRDV
ncbi:hypothetical protein PR048_000566 [Dryococelus australis]|uniref:Uncharacterized protein n=1 Tax=Dryococelus australis TaxID=614101 RepID=A0ABQ9IF14_9NEOP|nr:hypothetical protein PR048_000566 [Dryococelus australis]